MRAIGDENSSITQIVQIFFNPFPNKPLFFCVCRTSLLRTLWEKKKLLVTSNFSFSPSVFYPFGELSTIFIKSEIVIHKLFQFERVNNLLFGKGSILSQTSLVVAFVEDNAATSSIRYFENHVSYFVQN